MHAHITYIGLSPATAQIFYITQGSDTHEACFVFWQNKHEGVLFDAEACTNTHEVYGGTTKGA
jgi:hypothetical protein